MKSELAVKILQLIGNILGIGGFVALINWWLSNKSDKLARKITALQDQLNHLYGPLRFFTLQNEKCIEHTQKLSHATHSAYKDRVSNPNDDIQQRLDAELLKLSQIANEYAELAVNNNERIIKVLTDGYAYIEPDDVDLFSEVVLDYDRHKVEGNRPPALRMPLAVSMQLGEVFLMRPEFSARVKERFEAKKKELKSYAK